MASAKKQKVNDAATGAASDAAGKDLVAEFQKVQEVQDKLDEINEQAEKEILRVRVTYNKVRRPVYDERKELVAAIPDFWLTAVLSHPVLFTTLTEEDKKAMTYLTSVDVVDAEDITSGYKISLTFRDNPYFANSQLTKSFSFSGEGIVTIKGTEIQWKEGQDLTKKGRAVEPKEGAEEEDKENLKPSRKRTAASLNGEEEEDEDEKQSFFSWFQEDDGEFEEDYVQDELAEVIRQDLWPDPLKYFQEVFGEGDEDDEEEGGEGEGDDEGVEGGEDGKEKEQEDQAAKSA